jgi:hypothetical protein
MKKTILAALLCVAAQAHAISIASVHVSVPHVAVESVHVSTPSVHVTEVAPHISESAAAESAAINAAERANETRGLAVKPSSSQDEDTQRVINQTNQQIMLAQAHQSRVEADAASEASGTDATEQTDYEKWIIGAIVSVILFGIIGFPLYGSFKEKQGEQENNRRSGSRR